MVYEFAELADPVTETGFDGRLGAAGELGDPGESQGVGGFQADHFGLFFREGCEQPGDSFVFFAEFLIAGVVRKCGGPFGRQRRIAPVAVVVAAAVGDRPPEVAPTSSMRSRLQSEWKSRSRTSCTMSSASACDPVRK